MVDMNLFRPITDFNFSVLCVLDKVRSPNPRPCPEQLPRIEIVKTLVQGIFVDWWNPGLIFQIFGVEYVGIHGKSGIYAYKMW